MELAERCSRQLISNAMTGIDASGLSSQARAKYRQSLPARALEFIRLAESRDDSNARNVAQLFRMEAVLAGASSETQRNAIDDAANKYCDEQANVAAQNFSPDEPARTAATAGPSTSASAQPGYGTRSRSRVAPAATVEIAVANNSQGVEQQTVRASNSSVGVSSNEPPTLENLMATVASMSQRIDALTRQPSTVVDTPFLPHTPGYPYMIETGTPASSSTQTGSAGQRGVYTLQTTDNLPIISVDDITNYDVAKLRDVENYVNKMADAALSITQFADAKAVGVIDNLFLAKKGIVRDACNDSPYEENVAVWRQWPVTKILKALKPCMVKRSRSATAQTYVEAITAFNLECRFNSSMAVSKVVQELYEALETCSAPSKEDEQLAVSKLLSKHKDLVGSVSDPMGFVNDFLQRDKRTLRTVGDYRAYILELASKLEEGTYFAASYDPHSQSGDIKQARAGRERGTAVTHKVTQQRDAPNPQPEKSKNTGTGQGAPAQHAPCYKCGGPSHTPSKCRCDKPFLIDPHPDLNTNPNVAWRDSPQGRAYLAAFPRDKYLAYQSGKSTRAGWAYQLAVTSNSTSSNQQHGPRHKRPRHDNAGEFVNPVVWANATISDTDLSLYTIPAIISQHQDTTDPEIMRRTECRVLLDSGALSRDLVSRRLIDKLGNCIVCDSNSATQVCSGLDGQCTRAQNVMINLILRNEANEPLEITTNALVLENTPFDVIIGRDTIRQRRLVAEFPHYFTAEEADEPGPKRLTTQPTSETVVERALVCSCTYQPGAVCTNCSRDTQPINPDDTVDDGKVFACALLLAECCHSPQDAPASNEQQPEPPAVDSPLRDVLGQVTQPTSAVAQTVVTSTLTYDSGARHVEDDDGMEESWDLSAYPTSSTTESYEELIRKVSIQGSGQLQEDTLAILRSSEFAGLLSTTVAVESAKVTPLKLNVDDAMWRSPKNRGAPRPQHADKEPFIRETVQKMLDLGVIRTSQQPYYSQVHVALKPHSTELRFCVDYRSLNNATESFGWPLPRIEELLQRIGARKAKYFAVLDFTSGFHQTRLDEDSMKYTAFITPDGVYEFTRVPFGLKTAPSYFQEKIASDVLAGLLHFCCESYIDDVIVYGCTEAELLANLRKVLERLHQHNIKLNPKKFRVGLTSVEYVGHVLSADGLSMSEEKITKVLNFVRPTTVKPLRSFLGLTAYFHKHILDYAHLVRPLHMMAQGGNSKPVSWTQEAEAAFNAIKKAIEECPKLYFLDEKGVIYLHTDASDYGVGAHMFQVVDDEIHHIAFMSKSLHGAQLRWSTKEKECYAIVYALKKFEYLLRGRRFKLFTDHQNLLYVDSESSAKVVRWRLVIQDFDFTLGHIAGELNIVADQMSRLCPKLPDTVQSKLTQLALASTASASTQLTAAVVIAKAPDKNQQVDDGQTRVSVFVKNRPTKQQYAAISSVHNSIAGHTGVSATVNKLKQRTQPWLYMRRHVEWFIQRCPVCQKLSQMNPGVVAHKFSASSYRPMDRWAMDYAGPYSDGCFVLIIIDTFTRWVELFHTAAAT